VTEALFFISDIGAIYYIFRVNTERTGAAHGVTEAKKIEVQNEIQKGGA
jgi:hypothetical protein